MVIVTGDGLLMGKRQVRTFYGVGNVLYCSLGGGYMEEYIRKNSL